MRVWVSQTFRFHIISSQKLEAVASSYFCTWCFEWKVWSQTDEYSVDTESVFFVNAFRIFFLILGFWNFPTFHLFVCFVYSAVYYLIHFHIIGCFKFFQVFDYEHAEIKIVSHEFCLCIQEMFLSTFLPPGTVLCLGDTADETPCDCGMGILVGTRLYLPSPYCTSGALLTHLILITTWFGRYYSYSHFINEEEEPRGVECPHAPKGTQPAGVWTQLQSMRFSPHYAGLSLLVVQR